MKIVRVLGIIVGAYVVLALALDGFIAWRQPAAGDTLDLRTFDADGTAHVQRLSVTQEGDVLWVGSGHHFRGWYYRLRENPNVEVIRDGETRPYTAVPIDDPVEVDRITDRSKSRMGAAAYYASRAMLLFASVKPIRLDPRQP